MKKKNIWIGFFVIAFLLIVVGTSYALWQIVLKQSGTNVITTGCFKLTLTDESEGITLNEAFPITDEEGHQLDSYNFTITNTCSNAENYVINLETLSTGERIMPEKYLKTSLISNDEELFLSRLKPRFVNLEKGIDDATIAFKLYEGSLEGKTSKTFDLRMWIDEDTPASNEVMNAIYEGKIVVIASYTEPLNIGNMMMTRYDLLEDEEIDNFEFFSNSHQIIFENRIQAIDGIDAVDVSKNKTNTVLAYVDNSDPDNIVTHIQANGTILFPENSSYFFGAFKNLKSITGLENVNTSYVTEMVMMFSGTKVTSLNLNGWDVSNVVDMQLMFSETSVINNLDLSNWKISKNTVLNSLFLDINSQSASIEIESINLSGWDVSNIKFDEFLLELTHDCNVKNLNLSNWYVNSEMDDIQYDTNSFKSVENLNLSNWSFTTKINNASLLIPIHRVVNLDLSNWDISMVTDTREFFSAVCIGCENGDFPFLENLNLSGWDTSFVTDMSGMFADLSQLKTLNISTFDTTNVKDLSYIFGGCSNLTNIIYGSKFVYDSSKNIENMFYNSPANKPTDASWNGVFE